MDNSPKFTFQLGHGPRRWNPDLGPNPIPHMSGTWKARLNQAEGPLREDDIYPCTLSKTPACSLVLLESAFSYFACTHLRSCTLEAFKPHTGGRFQWTWPPRVPPLSILPSFATLSMLCHLVLMCLVAVSISFQQDSTGLSAGSASSLGDICILYGTSVTPIACAGSCNTHWK